MMASAPIESLRICSFCINSQFVPMYPSIHRQTYGTSELTVSRLWQTPPFLQGLSKHSFRSTHDLPSGVTRCPRAQLFIKILVEEREQITIMINVSVGIFLRLLVKETCNQ